jgi:hypothetical protein
LAQKGAAQKQCPYCLIVFSLSLVYWLCLAAHSHSYDIIGYQDLGRIWQHQGLWGYLKTGPHREPIYPLLCAWAMSIETLTGIAFNSIMASISVMILMATQVLMYIILRELNIRSWICSLGLFYLCISPAITNSGFHLLLFCEVITYPLVLAIVLGSYYGWRCIQQNRKLAACGYGAISGIMFTLLTLVKAIFEGIFPGYFLVFFIAAVYKNKISYALICFLTAGGLLFYVPVTTYKCLNKKYNGNFVIRDFGALNLYGNAQRRTESLTLRQYLSGVAFGVNVCEKYFNRTECSFWTFDKADAYGSQKMDELTNRHLPPPLAHETLLKLSVQKALISFPQYILLTFTQSLRMYFWEGGGGFIPLGRIAAGATFLAILFCCFNIRQLPHLIFLSLTMIFLFVAASSFFDILPRFMLPIVPLYIIIMCFSFNSFLQKSTII